jgi:hypothetical protein
LPLIFEKRDGKWYPKNPDGSEHWDLCKVTTRAKNPPKAKPVLYTKSKHTHFYPDIKTPPWDDRLGAFRDFTPAEKELIDQWNRRWLKTL